MGVFICVPKKHLRGKGLNLERQFRKDMVGINENALKETGYNTSRFIQLWVMEVAYWQ